jgi:hypothetical protein
LHPLRVWTRFAWGTLTTCLLPLSFVPGSLSAEEGIEVTTHCKSILSAHDIDDVHVEIRESEVFRSTGPKMSLPQTLPPGPESLSPLPSVFQSAPKSPHPSRELADSSPLSTLARSTSSQRDTSSSTLMRNPTCSTSTPSAAETSCCLATQLSRSVLRVQNHVLVDLERAKKAVGPLEKFHADISKDWENRILGYVVPRIKGRNATVVPS